MIGWQCPGCGRCFAPFVAQCASCGPSPAAPAFQVRCTCREMQAGSWCPVHPLVTQTTSGEAPT